MAKDKKKPDMPEGGWLQKSPRASASPISGKTPRLAAIISHDDETPIWSFSTVDIGSKWCFSALDATQITTVLNRLKNFETMPWRDLHGTKRHHQIETQDITADARERLQILNQEDIEAVYSMGVTGAFRVWGIRDGRVLKLLWFDPNHEICPSKLKNT